MGISPLDALRSVRVRLVIDTDRQVVLAATLLGRGAAKHLHAATAAAAGEVCGTCRSVELRHLTHTRHPDNQTGANGKRFASRRFRIAPDRRHARALPSHS